MAYVFKTIVYNWTVPSKHPFTIQTVNRSHLFQDLKRGLFRNLSWTRLKCGYEVYTWKHMFNNSGCILEYRQRGYGISGSYAPFWLCNTCYEAFQATSVTVDVWVSSGQRKLAIEDLTTKKQEARWVTFSRLLYLFCYCNLLFSSKEPQENSLNNLVFKKVLGLLKDSFVSSGMLVTILRSVVR